MGSLGEEEDSRDVELNRSKRFNEEREGRDSKNKKTRISEPVHQSLGVSEGFGNQKGGTIRNELVGSVEEMNLIENVGLNLDDETIDLELNLEFPWRRKDEFLPPIAERRAAIVEISSNESEDYDLNIVGGKDVNGRIEQIHKENADISSSAGGERRYTRKEKGKAKVSDSWLSLSLNVENNPISEENAEEFMNNIDLGLRLLQTSFVLSGSAEGERRYTREEKGKAKVSDSLLSHDLDVEYNPISTDLPFRIEQEQNVEQSDAQLVEKDDDERTSDFINPQLPYNAQMEQYDAREWRKLYRLRTARRFARSEDYNEAPKNKEKASSDDNELFRKYCGPFSTALKMVQERSTSSDQQLIKWEPSSNKGSNQSRGLAPSLLDLCLKVLSQNAEAIVSLELVPDILQHRLADLLCDLRKMNAHTLKPLLKGSPTEIRIKDCSWLTDEQFLQAFGNLNKKELMVLQLDLCGQCNLDYIISQTLAQGSNSLPKLGIISLKGACRLSDYGLRALLTSAPRLQSINLSQNCLVTHAGINIIAATLGSLLKELYIDECLNIDAMLALPALKKFDHLEVLSVAGIETVSDLFVHELLAICGQSIKELDLAGCRSLTNYSLKVIGDLSTKLRSLNISNLDKLSDLGLLFLADGCRCIETLKFSRNNFSDEAIAAFLEASGKSLKDLSLNSLKLVGPCTALSLAKCSRKLLSLDVSWCRRITDEALGLIVDSCSSLKLLKLFGCTQITDIFLKGHSNPQVKIIGPRCTRLMENTNMLQSHGTLLRYSPLASIQSPRKPMNRRFPEYIPFF